MSKRKKMSCQINYYEVKINCNRISYGALFDYHILYKNNSNNNNNNNNNNNDNNNNNNNNNS